MSELDGSLVGSRPALVAAGCGCVEAGPVAGGSLAGVAALWIRALRMERNDSVNEGIASFSPWDARPLKSSKVSWRETSGCLSERS